MDRRPRLQLHLDLAARPLRHRPRRHRPQRPAARHPDRRPPGRRPSGAGLGALGASRDWLTRRTSCSPATRTGNFAPILRACAARPPGTLILLGDCDLPAPLAQILAPAIGQGWDVRWILGNHDTETEAAYDNLTTHPGDLGLRVTTIGGLRIAGLPGRLQAEGLAPRPTRPPRPSTPAPPSRRPTPRRSLARRPAAVSPRHHFPRGFRAPGRPRFDILVSHEAPSSHPHGFAVIDALAEACGAQPDRPRPPPPSPTERLFRTASGSEALGLAEPWLLDRPPPLRS